MDLLRQILRYRPNKESSLMGLMNECDALWNYSLKYEKGFDKKVANVATLLFCVIAIAFQKLCLQPFSGFLVKRRTVQLLQQIKSDKALLKDKDSSVAALVDSIVKQESLFEKLDPEECEFAKDVAMATYATTNTYLAPVLLDWTKSLLIRAKERNLRLVFIARDGLGPYEMAKTLQKENPEFAAIPLSYIYLSREVVKGDFKKLSQYLLQEGISPDSVKDGQRFLFVDIGFLGSTIPRIRKSLAEIGIPSDPISSDNKVYFEFCVSTGKRAHGFVGNLKSVLPSVQSAGKNRGIYWTEDSHQGTIDSPTEIVVGKSGLLVPNSVEYQKTCRDRNELDYLCKKVALEALRDAAKRESDIKKDVTRNYELVEVSLRAKLDNFLRESKFQRILYVDHK